MNLPDVDPTLRAHLILTHAVETAKTLIRDGKPATAEFVMRRAGWECEGVLG